MRRGFGVRWLATALGWVGGMRPIGERASCTHSKAGASSRTPNESGAYAYAVDIAIPTGGFRPQLTCRRPSSVLIADR